jgi:hypothetical protein
VPPVPAATANADLRCVVPAPGFASRQSHSFGTCVLESTLLGGSFRGWNHRSDNHPK